MAVLEQLREAIISGNRDQTKALTQQALSEGIPAKQIVVDGIAAAMAVVGEKFRNNEFFVPELLIAQRAMKESLKMMSGESVDYVGTVVIGTVKGDLHDIGKNLVAIMLKGAGFEVIDLGNDVAPERFVEAARQEQADVIGMSALLTTTMPVMKQVVDLAKKSGLAARTKIVIGGAPLSAEYAREIGADAYCYDASSAVDYVKKAVGRG